MMPGPHPEMDELILYCMGVPRAEQGSAPARKVDAATVDRVRLHLKECADCRAQAALLCSDLALVAMAVPQVTPPADAKARLFKAAGVAMPQTGTSSAGVSNNNVLPMKGRRQSPGLIWAGWIAAAACLFYAVQVREANHGMRQQLSSENALLI